MHHDSALLLVSGGMLGNQSAVAHDVIVEEQDDVALSRSGTRVASRRRATVALFDDFD